MGRACSSATSFPRSRSTRGQRVLERALQGAGDKPVLGLARVELPLGALGVIFGALHREALADDQLLVLILELGDRAGGGGQPGGRDRFQERVDDGLLQSPAAEGLALRAGVMQSRATHARIPADLPAGAGIGDLHPSAAATAPHQPLQQRGALAGGAATFAARSHVLRAVARGWRGIDPS